MLPSDTHVSGLCQMCNSDLKKKKKPTQNVRDIPRLQPRPVPARGPTPAASVLGAFAGGQRMRTAGRRSARHGIRSKHVPLGMSANCSTFSPPPPLLRELRHLPPFSARRGVPGRQGAGGPLPGPPSTLPDPAQPCTDPAGEGHTFHDTVQR